MRQCSKPQMTWETLRSLCIGHQWFTTGSNAQYQKLYDLAAAGCTIDTLAMVIWVCSSSTDMEYIETIRKTLAMYRYK